jgi:hypothetical protein
MIKIKVHNNNNNNKNTLATYFKIFTNFLFISYDPYPDAAQSNR